MITVFGARQLAEVAAALHTAEAVLRAEVVDLAVKGWGGCGEY